MRAATWSAIGAAAMAIALPAWAGDFGSPGGPEPANVAEIAEMLRRDPYDLELLVSFGTSKGGSAGHLALALRDAAPGDDLVYSANFYADRDPAHEKDRYTDDLMVRIPKMEYLYGTVSSVSGKAAFGLDFGEVYKRSVIGIRVRGVPEQEKRALATYFQRINDDFHGRARDTPYHDGEVRYDYLRLNCAKTIGVAFRIGAGYEDLEVESPAILSRRKIVAALNANIPTEMAMKLLKAWNARGYRLDVVLYRKYAGSAYVDPHEEEKIAFKDLPNRFPSVLSRDFRKDEGQYEDADNLFAMYVLHNLMRHSIRVNGKTRRLEVGESRQPMAYARAAAQAEQSASADSESFRRRQPFRPKGTPVDADREHPISAPAEAPPSSAPP